MRRDRRKGSRHRVIYVSLVVALVVVLVLAYSYSQGSQEKPVILYVDQGNGAVNVSNFGQMLGFASSHGFNTIFFQVYREGVLLFNSNELRAFVNQSHAQHLKLFFALYFTDPSQVLPTSVTGLGEDGISLDMSALPLPAQMTLLGSLASCHCQTAVTTTDMGSPLKPDILVLETYGAGLTQYIRPGIVASVGVFATSSQADYQQQFQYALNNSDGVMVFDYAGLMKAGY